MVSESGGAGFAEAQNDLGFMCREGLGNFPKDPIEAVKWFRKAAEQGFAEAQNNLGFMFEKGLAGLSKDEAEAVKWYRKAAEQGYALGQFIWESPARTDREVWSRTMLKR